MLLKNSRIIIISVILAILTYLIGKEVYENIFFRNMGLIPVTVDTEKYTDLLEGRITKLTDSQYTFYRRLDRTSNKVYIDAFDSDGKLVGSTVFDLPLSF